MGPFRSLGTSATVLLILALVFGPLVACASIRSNTRELEERVFVHAVKVPAGPTDESAITVAELGSYVVSLGLSALRKVVDLEAVKYTAEYSGSTTINREFEQSAQRNPFAPPSSLDGFVFIVSRFCKPAPNHSLPTFPTAFGATAEEECNKAVEDARKSGLRSVDLPKDLSGTVNNQAVLDDGDGWVPTTRAVFLAIPSRNGEAFRLYLAAMWYGSLKAKSMDIYIPFVNPDRTKAVASVRFSDPLGGDIDATFDLGDVGGDEARTIQFSPRRELRSRILPIAKCSTSDVRFHFVETNQGREWLLKLSAKIGELEKD